MAFVDEYRVHVKAGDGGHGVVRWLHLKGKEYSGPAGGDGGRGGDVVVKAVRDIAVLAKHIGKGSFKAGRGEDGKSTSKHGANGADAVIEVPIGSVITNLTTGESAELLTEGAKMIVATGGRGGLGNEYFKSSTNQTPQEWTPGKKGEAFDIRIELQLIADAGFIGLPNAGKSSLLNALTGARAKVADYAFTTLDPNLGVMFGYILADIPGLIEGASTGKGLGHKFLRHVRRTRVILHCLSLEHDDPVAPYNTIREELVRYDSELAEKQELLILTKADTVSPKELKDKLTRAKDLTKNVVAVSVLDDGSLKNLRDTITAFLSR